MPGIESKLTETVIKSASKLLESRTLGGVTKESANKAISNAAESVRTVANEQIGAAQREINQLRREANISATRIAELTSEKDAVVLQTESLQSELENYKNIIDALKARLEKALGIRVQEPKVLSNGNIEHVKMNKNGAKMTTTTLPDGRKISVEVETTAGKRKTTYNPVTGKPIKTFTNVRVSESNKKIPDERMLSDRLIEYNQEGATKLIKNVNNKKVKPQKPNVVSKQIIGTENGVTTTRKAFSDGSYEIGKVFVNNNNEVRHLTTKLYNNDDKMIQETTYTYHFDKIRKETAKYNPDTGNKTSVLVKDGVLDGGKEKYKTSCENFLNENGEIYKKVTVFEELGGLKQIISAKVDEFGIVDKTNPSLKYIYPKSSKIKSSTVYQTKYDMDKEVLTLRDGTIVEVKINNNYYPTRIVIKEKGKTETIEIKSIDAIYNYFREIGKINEIRSARGENIMYNNWLNY